MDQKRPIDRLRDSAFSMEIDGDGDDSPISEMIPIGDTMYIIKGHSIHAVQLADQIDPGRTNITIPHTHQQVLTMGAEDPIVARTFLTAHTLFQRTVLGNSFDEEAGLKLALRLLEDLVALGEMLNSLSAAEAHAQASFEAQKQRASAMQLPRIGDTKPRCDAFAQKAGHVVAALEEIAKLFYPRELATKWIDSLLALAKKRYGEEGPFAQYISAARPFLLLVIGMRNMIEHPSPNKHIQVSDFRLLPSGQIALPSAKIVRPKHLPEIANITLLMKKVIDDLVSVSEMLVAHLCSVNVNRADGLPIHVAELPMEQRSNKNQRFYYGCFLGDQLCRFG